MTSAVDIVARDRAPLEKRRRQLLAELERVNRELSSIGNVSVRNAARRWNQELSRMKRWEILDNNRARGRGRIARWWVAGQAPRPDHNSGEKK